MIDCEASNLRLVATRRKYCYEIAVLERAIIVVNTALESLSGWRAFQWVWKKKILRVKLNTYRRVLFEKKIFVLQAELENEKYQNVLHGIEKTVENETIAEFWTRKACCPVCRRHARETRSAV